MVMWHAIRAGGDDPVEKMPSLSPPPAVFSPVSDRTGALLLETQRPDARNRFSYLLKDPEKILTSYEADKILSLLEEAEKWQAKGFAVAGFLSYEAGWTLAGITPPGESLAEGKSPLLWLGVYRGFARYDHFSDRWEYHRSSPEEWPCGTSRETPPDTGSPLFRFSLSRQEYLRKVEEIRSSIREGDVYQANLTGHVSFPFAGDPFSLYLRLHKTQPVPYGAFLRAGDAAVISRSPELFFRVRGDRIEAQPMKGTAPRGLTGAEDRRKARNLRNDPKNRAENLMIVDLVRNDLGKVCRPGSVEVARPFEVKRYRTLLQMVSTVTGKLLPRTGAGRIFSAMFPCGSITGAPKIAAMHLLARLEGAPRGIYTGAIGILLPGGDMTFSVAIRTTVLREGRAETGVGGGIVWDSDQREEYREVRLKARYLVEPAPDFCLIETFLWTPKTGFRFLSDHLGRLASSARYFGFRFVPKALLSILESAAASFHRDGDGRKVRLLLGKDGEISVEDSPLPPRAEGRIPVQTMLARVAVHSRDLFLRHKTTNRAWRDKALEEARRRGYGEVLFLNEKGEITEGAVSNVFAEVGGRLLTSPASCGLLAGILRRRILKDRMLPVTEKALHPEDLCKADRIFLTNSVRGVLEAVPPAGLPPG